MPQTSEACTDSPPKAEVLRGAWSRARQISDDDELLTLFTHMKILSDSTFNTLTRLKFIDILIERLCLILKTRQLSLDGICISLTGLLF